MIKFFRHIRKRLLSENRFNKYLLYAIGEIVLVVIGILIALQINNWNESRKLAQSGKEFIKEIYKELNTEIANIDEILKLLRTLTVEDICGKTLHGVSVPLKVADGRGGRIII